MIYLRTTCFILLAFALHIGCTALVHVGWPPQPLVIVTVLAVWLERSPALGRTVLPAALLVDVLQPTRVPLVTFAVLVAWFVAALVQRQWLTNRSLASLFGLGVLSLLAAGVVTAACLWAAASIGVSATPFLSAWSTRGTLQTFAIEAGVVVLLGVSIRIAARFFQQRFLYAAR